jgi:hypothetical protein
VAQTFSFTERGANRIGATNEKSSDDGIALAALSLTSVTGAQAASVYVGVGGGPFYGGYYGDDYYYYRYHHPYYYGYHYPYGYYGARYDYNDWYWRHHYWRHHYWYHHDRDWDDDGD